MVTLLQLSFLVHTLLQEQRIDRTIDITPKRPDPALFFPKEDWINIQESFSATTGQRGTQALEPDCPATAQSLQQDDELLEA